MIMKDLILTKSQRDSKESSEKTLLLNHRHIVKFTVGLGQQRKVFLDELIVLEENEKAIKIKGLETGVHWHEKDFINNSVKVLFRIPFKKKTMRDSVKLWLVKHL